MLFPALKIPTRFPMSSLILSKEIVSLGIST